MTKPLPIFLAAHEGDVEPLRKLGARVWYVRDCVGIAEDDVVLIARGDGNRIHEICYVGFRPSHAHQAAGEGIRSIVPRTLSRPVSS